MNKPHQKKPKHISKKRTKQNKKRTQKNPNLISIVTGTRDTYIKSRSTDV